MRRRGGRGGEGGGEEGEEGEEKDDQKGEEILFVRGGKRYY